MGRDRRAPSRWYAAAVCLAGCVVFSCMHVVEPVAAGEPGPLVRGPVGEIRFEIPPEAMFFIDSTPAPRSFKEYRFDVEARVRHGAEHQTLSRPRVKIRGESTRGFRKKSLKVYTADRHSLFNAPYPLNEFILVSLTMDPGYISTLLGYSVLREAGLFFPHFEYVRGYINGEYMGLYLFVEDPVESMRRIFNSVPFVFRRNYGPSFEYRYTAPSRSRDESVRENHRLVGMYSLIDYFRGQALVDSLGALINLRQYNHWLAINNLLRNGDYLDEVFFYALPVRAHPSRLVYHIHGWDYDDLFEPPHANLPFEGKLLYCSEDPLDVALGTDSVAYRWYLAQYDSLLREVLPPVFFDELERKIRGYILPLFEDEATATVMNNFSSDPRHARSELEQLIGARFAEIAARHDSITAVLEVERGF